MRPREHVYVPDPALPADHRNRRPCHRCGLPESSRLHRDPPDHDTDRITGDKEQP